MTMKLGFFASIVFAISLTESNADRSIAFAGGGFRAHAVASGVMSGLLGAAIDNEAASTKPTFETLLQDIKSVSSNSGGTWFATQFIYSANFQNLLLKMANASQSPGSHYDAEFVEGLFRKMGTTALEIQGRRLFFDDIDEAVTSILEVVDNFKSWIALVSNYLRPNGKTWRGFVDLILRTPGDFDPSLPLDTAPINNWAHNKRYAIAGALIQPKPDLDEAMSASAFELPCIGDDKDLHIRSVTMNNQYESEGLASPITFSVNLKSGGDIVSDSPFEFQHIASSSEGRSMTYYLMSESNFFNWGWTQNRMDFHYPAGTKVGPGRQSHRMPILDVATTSSSFLSQIASLHDALGTIALTLKQLGVWDFILGMVVPLALEPSLPAEDMFDIGAKLSEKQPQGQLKNCDGWLGEYGKAYISPVADGGYVDNTAVSNILADAKDGDEFTLILNSDSDINEDIANLFLLSPMDRSLFTPYPVVNQFSSNAVTYQKAFKSLELPKSNSMLNSLRYGSVDVKTARQDYFGVKAGINIRLNFIAVNARMSLAPLTWDQPAKLVEDIVNTLKLPSNRDQVKGILKSFIGY